MRVMMICIYLFLSLSVSAQQQQRNNKNIFLQVEITDWNQRCVFQNEQVWTINKDSIISQIGETEFEKAKSNSDMPTWPTSMQLPMTKRRDTAFMRSYFEKLNQLKMFKIASYINNLGAKPIRYALLKVPYEENKNWDYDVKWDTIYFIVEEKYLALPGITKRQ